MNVDTVSVSKAEYKELSTDLRWLCCCLFAGVEKWEDVAADFDKLKTLYLDATQVSEIEK